MKLLLISGHGAGDPGAVGEYRGRTWREADETRRVTAAVAEALDGLPAHKLHCSVLAEEAIKKALQDYYDRNGIPYQDSDFPEHASCHSCCGAQE